MGNHADKGAFFYNFCFILCQVVICYCCKMGCYTKVVYQGKLKRDPCTDNKNLFQQEILNFVGLVHAWQVRNCYEKGSVKY